MEENERINIYGPNYIRRNVYEDTPNVWIYRVEKTETGAVSSQTYILP